MHPAFAKRRRQVRAESSPLATHGEQIAELLAPFRLNDAERATLARPSLRVERRRWYRGA